jgi:hypothetical protein
MTGEKDRRMIESQAKEFGHPAHPLLVVLHVGGGRSGPRPYTRMRG